MKLSIGIPPGPHAREVAKRAEELGYDRVWLFDSPALYEDVWIHLAQVAEATEHIGLGTSVAVPSTRHVMTAASSIVAIERLAPGRLACAWGTGMTARRAMGQNALTWSFTRTYLTQLRGLLNGETVEIEGKRCRMLHHPENAAPGPHRVPFILSAFGPKGVGIAREIGDGWMGSGGAPVPEGFDWNVMMIQGTVLNNGESPHADRVFDSAGPWHVGTWHSTWEWAPDHLTSLPGGSAFLETVNKLPEEERHFAVHAGHVTHLNEADRAGFDSLDWKPDWATWVGTKDDLQQRAKDLEAGGSNDLLFCPSGDRIREIEAWYDAMAPLQD